MILILAWPTRTRARLYAFFGSLLIVWAVVIANVAPEESHTYQFHATEVQK